MSEPPVAELVSFNNEVVAQYRTHNFTFSRLPGICFGPDWSY